MKEKYLKNYLLFAFSVELLTFVLQLFIVYSGPGNFFIKTIRLTTFFTITTNLLLLICYSSLLFSRERKIGQFFSNGNNLTALLTYICFVCIIYHLLLINVWNPQGLQWYVGELLHWINPLIYLLFWIIFVDKHEIKYRVIPYWLAYPIIYFVWVMILGLMGMKFPYPFFELKSIGIFKVFGFGFLLLLSLAAMGTFFVFSAKYYFRNKTNGIKTNIQKNNTH